MSYNKIKGIILTLLGGTAWGMSGVCGQYLFQQKGLSAEIFILWRVLLSGLLLVSAAVPVYKKDIFKCFSKENLPVMLFFSLISITSCQYTFFKAISYSNSATATVVQYVSPAIVMLYTCLRYKKLPAPVQLTALICAMLAVFFMATGGKIGSLAMSPKAVGFALVSGVCYASYSLISPKLSQKCGLMPMLGFANLIGSIPLFIINFNQLTVPLDTEALLVFLIGCVLIGNAVSFAMYTYGCRLVGSVTGSLCACIEPLSAAVIAFLWLGTAFKPTDILGLVLILCTVILLTINPKKGKKHKPQAA